MRGFEGHGVLVTTRNGIEALSIAPEGDGQAFGAVELRSRCSESRAFDPIEDVSLHSPECGAERERLYYWIEG